MSSAQADRNDRRGDRILRSHPQNLTVAYIRVMTHVWPLACPRGVKSVPGSLALVLELRRPEALRQTALLSVNIQPVIGAAACQLSP